MHSLKDIQLKCNKQFIVYFDEGELSSDGGLLIIKESLCTLGIEKILQTDFKTNVPALFRIHKDPVLSTVLGKKALASQPTLSRFFNRMDDDTLRQFDDIMRQLHKKVHSI